MKITLTKKDLIKFETYLSTDTASIGLWDKEKMNNWITDSTKHMNEFINALDGPIENFKKSMIYMETGSDGNFQVNFYFNQELSEEHKKIVYKSQKGILLHTAGSLILGEPAYVGQKITDEGINRNFLDLIELDPGEYVVDAYSLLLKDADGKARFLQLALCIFFDKYKGEKIQLDKVLDFGYDG